MSRPLVPFVAPAPADCPRHLWFLQDLSPSEKQLKCATCGMIRKAGVNIGIEVAS